MVWLVCIISLLEFVRVCVCVCACMHACSLMALELVLRFSFYPVIACRKCIWLFTCWLPVHCHNSSLSSQVLINIMNVLTSWVIGSASYQCAGCLRHHKLVDNLGLITEYDFREETNMDWEIDQVWANHYWTLCFIYILYDSPIGHWWQRIKNLYSFMFQNKERSKKKITIYARMSPHIGVVFCWSFPYIWNDFIFCKPNNYIKRSHRQRMWLLADVASECYQNGNSKAGCCPYLGLSPLPMVWWCSILWLQGGKHGQINVNW